MLPMRNEHVEELDKPTEHQQFHEMYVKQVLKARSSVFADILNELGVGNDYNYIAARYLKTSRKVTKEKLSDWLETTAHILDQYCLPWLEKAAPLAEEVRVLRSENQTLKDENTVYQKQIIDLQNQVIEKQNEQLKSVQSTIEQEMKTYSAAVSGAVSKSCSTAMAPKKIQAAVQNLAKKEERSKNVIVYGLKEAEGEQLDCRVGEVLAELGEKPMIRDSCRIGISKGPSINYVPRTGGRGGFQKCYYGVTWGEGVSSRRYVTFLQRGLWAFVFIWYGTILIYHVY